MNQSRVVQHSNARPAVGRLRVFVLSTFGAVGILAAYVFFASAGHWTSWPETTRYYDQLATAFRGGHLYLSIQPPDALLALPNPYKPAARNSIPEVRAFVDTVGDMSFYHGKFYLYWGPAPALLLTLVKIVYGPPIPDQFLVFVFLGGLAIFTILLIVRLWRGRYQDVPSPLLLVSILVAVFVCPIPWMLDRAAIYEATIAAGQCFLVGGLYFAYCAVDRPVTSNSKLLLANVFWVLAATSRTVVLVPAAFLTFMTFVWTVRNGVKPRQLLSATPRLLKLAVPFAAGAIGIAWYNWARFGSVLETGLRYTLTYRDLNRFYGESFSALHILPSLWIYLFNPPVERSTFPFLSAKYGEFPSLLALSQLHIYHAEAVTGLIFSVPFAVFSIVAIANTFHRLVEKLGRKRPAADNPAEDVITWFLTCLTGSAFLPFAAILFYFNVTMRFLAEFIPSLMILSALGLWQGYMLLRQKRTRTYLYTSAAIGLAAATIMVSVLLTISENYDKFPH